MIFDAIKVALISLLILWIIAEIGRQIKDEIGYRKYIIKEKKHSGRK